MRKIIESPKETAKHVRNELKAFKHKFSVKTQVYSMGSSIYISWVDGPYLEEVQDKVSKYNSATFDGMTDYKDTPGYVREIDGEKVLVRGADFIVCQRERSPERTAAVKQAVFEKYALTPKDAGYPYYSQKVEKEIYA